jgi:hypothetical protein
MRGMESRHAGFALHQGALEHNLHIPGVPFARSIRQVAIPVNVIAANTPLTIFCMLRILTERSIPVLCPGLFATPGKVTVHRFKLGEVRDRLRGGTAIEVHDLLGR